MNIVPVKLFLGITLLCSFHLYGQVCDNKFSSLIYKSISFDSVTNAITASDGTIVGVGNIFEDHGIIAKFSSKGIPLFTYQYNPVYQYYRTFYKTLRFADIAQTRDGSLIAAGNLIVDRWFGQTEFVNKAGVLLKIDVFGNIVWSKILQTESSQYNSGFDVAVTNVLETSENNLIVYLSSDNGTQYPAYGKVVCFSSDGKQKWSTLLATGSYDGGTNSLRSKRGILQSNNGSFIVADVVYKTNHSTGEHLSCQLHLLSLNAQTGKLNWEKNYEYPLNDKHSYTDVTSVSESDNGNLVFVLSKYFSSSNQKSIRIETDNRGEIQNATIYSTKDNMLNEIIDVSTEKNTGNQTYLFRTPTYSAIAFVSKSGEVQWQEGFDHANGLFPANCVTPTSKGYGIFMSSFNSHNMRLLLTDAKGQINCANIPVEFKTQPATLIKGEFITTDPLASDRLGLMTTDFPLQLTTNPLEATIECEEKSNCCKNVADSSLQTIHVCEGSNYFLPGNTLIKQSGTYYVVYKTSLGCDSIQFYKIQFDKNPSSLTLGEDLCINGKDSLVLHASEGFDNYEWINNSVINQSSLIVKQKGTYWVTVNNSCGRKTDSVNVYDECNFPVYMPNSFSPNNDGNNDIFRVPSLNKNKFVRLTIFNRWGQLIFSSKELNKGWDGNFNHKLQPAGVYIYFVEMQDYSGKTIKQSGTVLLIR